MTASQVRTALVVASLAVTVLTCPVAHAQSDWPSKPVTLVVPSSAGGGTDVYGRILAQALSEQFKQTFVVENKPGASGAIGATAVARAAPDGYTLLVASNSSLGINPVLFKALQYDVSKDFVAVTRGVIAPMVVVAHPDAKVKTLAELLERGKREPGKVFYGTAGVGSPLYIGVRMMEAMGGVGGGSGGTAAQFSHVPYKGVAPAYQDLLGGRLHFMLTDLASARQFIDSGKLVALAITDKSKLLPTVPTFAEAGLPKYPAFTSFSVMLPAKTPQAIVNRLALEIGKAMKDPTNVNKLEQQALLPVFDTPEQFSASLRDEQLMWGNFIRQHNIQPD